MGFKSPVETPNHENEEHLLSGSRSTTLNKEAFREPDWNRRIRSRMSGGVGPVTDTSQSRGPDFPIVHRRRLIRRANPAALTSSVDDGSGTTATI